MVNIPRWVCGNVCQQSKPCLHSMFLMFAHTAYIKYILFGTLPALKHGANRAVVLFWHTAWLRTWRPWRKTSGSRIKAVSSWEPLGKRAGCCFESCWSATSSPRLLSSEGDSSPLRTKRMKTWLVGWFFSSADCITWDSSCWHCVFYASRFKRWWTLRSLMIMLLPSRAMMLATAAWVQPELKQGL